MKPTCNTMLLIALVVSVLMISCGKQQDAKTPSTETPAYIDSLTIELAGVDGKTVLEITRDSVSVEYTESAMGAFVNAVDSVANDGGYWWVYTINDSIAQVACDKYITTDGDKITWYYRKQ
ncbi:MAG: DUF4430 domain-containing protein [candidate division Zixibacteria bacterium]|nr:DUF4430 domain-containing protein [candidate division Zixibacteria bacterium]